MELLGISLLFSQPQIRRSEISDLSLSNNISVLLRLYTALAERHGLWIHDFSKVDQSPGLNRANGFPTASFPALPLIFVAFESTPGVLPATRGKDGLENDARYWIMIRVPERLEPDFSLGFNLFVVNPILTNGVRHFFFI